jgi:DNA-binding NtrC family response regulator
MSETNKKRMKRIFLIEDDAKFAKSFCRLLIDEGYEVTANSNAGIAVGWATDKEIGFDMIISDQQMPGEVGSSFLAFLATL